MPRVRSRLAPTSAISAKRKSTTSPRKLNRRSRMDLMLTDEQKQAAEMVRRFAHTEIAPTIQDWDRKQQMNPDVLPRMGELGILGINIPQQYGGQGYDYITLGLVCEELERVDTTLRVIMSVHMG